MNPLVTTLDALIAGLRVILFVAGAGVAALAALTHVVRTRRLSPFGTVGRFVRGSVDPLFVPVERRVVRAGGRPATAPWWTVAAVVVGGIVVLGLLGFVRDQISGAIYAAAMGPRGILLLVVGWTFAVLRIALFARVISSWFRTSRYSPWVRWAYALTDWFVVPLGRVVPPIGMIDITPIVAYFALWVAERLVMSII